MQLPASVAVSTVLLACACSEADGGFVDATEVAGVAFQHDNGFRGNYYYPETFGSGVALVDVDSDGDLDIYAVQCGPMPGSLDDLPGTERPTNRLYANDGTGSFSDATQRSGDAAHSGFGMGVSAGDVDGDGRIDLFVTNFGPDALLVNQGDGSFVDAARGRPVADPRWTTASGFADLDRDGHLDLVVLGYLHWDMGEHRQCSTAGVLDYCDVQQFDGIPDRAWKGDGRGGFEERSEQWGIGEKVGKGLGVALVDLDEDGDVDVYVANDTTENFLYMNRGDGSMQDATAASGASLGSAGRAEAGMGVAVADCNEDGRPDLLVTNFSGESNALYANEGGGRFRDVSRSCGIAAPSRPLLGFGTSFQDFDRDGRPDLLVTNGHVLRHVDLRRAPWSYAQPAQLLFGAEDGRFVLESPRGKLTGGADLEAPHVGRGLACGDWDNDGAIDAVFLDGGGTLRLLRNRMSIPGSRSLRVVVTAKGTNTMAVGASLRLVLDDGSALTHWVRSGTGYLSQDDLHPTFALPPEAVPAQLEIRWPDGNESRHDVNSTATVVHVAQP